MTQDTSNNDLSEYETSWGYDIRFPAIIHGSDEYSTIGVCLKKGSRCSENTNSSEHNYTLGMLSVSGDSNGQSLSIHFYMMP